MGRHSHGSVHRKGQGYRHSWAAEVGGRTAVDHKGAAGHKEVAGHKMVVAHKEAAGVGRMAAAGHTTAAAGEAVADCKNLGRSIGRRSRPGGCPEDSLDRSQSQHQVLLEYVAAEGVGSTLVGILLATSSLTILGGQAFELRTKLLEERHFGSCRVSPTVMTVEKEKSKDSWLQYGMAERQVGLFKGLLVK